jgi:hypothetical protein
MTINSVKTSIMEFNRHKFKNQQIRQLLKQRKFHSLHYNSSERETERAQSATALAKHDALAPAANDHTNPVPICF